MLTSAIQDLFDATKNIEERIYALETRLSHINTDHDRQSVRDRLHIVLMGPPCSGCSIPTSLYLP